MELCVYVIEVRGVPRDVCMDVCESARVHSHHSLCPSVEEVGSAHSPCLSPGPVPLLWDVIWLGSPALSAGSR